MTTKPLTELSKALSLPKDITEDEVLSLFLRSLPQDWKDRMQALEGTTWTSKWDGELEGVKPPPLGKKGKTDRDAYKAMERVELVYRGDTICLTS